MVNTDATTKEQTERSKSMREFIVKSVLHLFFINFFHICIQFTQ